MKISGLVISALFLFSAWAAQASSIQPGLTPGVLCTVQDPDFQSLDYAEQIPRCIRNVSQAEKFRIAAAYGGIPQSDWSKYEFDHLLPLCAGGSDAIGNVWPEPIAEAHEKDKLENAICREMRAGRMTQAQAIQKIYDFMNAQLEQAGRTIPGF